MADSAIPPTGRLVLGLMRRNDVGVRRWPGSRSYGLESPGAAGSFGAHFQTRTIDSLAARGLIALDGEVYRLTPAGMAAADQQKAAP